MVLEDSAAGRAAVEVLIESGRLVPDFWLRAESQRHLDFDERKKQVASAVKFAMGASGVELPDWASPMKDSPDCVWINPELKKEFSTQEPYYFPADLYRSFAKCRGNVDPNTRQGQEIRKNFINLAWRSWNRLVPHFNSSLAQDILDIESERGNNGYTFSKQVRKDNIVSGACIRDAALYEFYIEQGEAGLKQVFHGIGRKAMLGVGAMLFLSGEHDDLLYAAEQLSDELDPK